MHSLTLNSLAPPSASLHSHLTLSGPHPTRHLLADRLSLNVGEEDTELRAASDLRALAAAATHAIFWPFLPPMLPKDYFTPCLSSNV